LVVGAERLICFAQVTCHGFRFDLLRTGDVPWIPLWSMTDEMVVAYLPGVKNCFVDISMDVSIQLIDKE
jgi:hypothetical protein